MARGQRASEGQMLDTCIIRRPIGQDTDENGVVTDNYDPTPVYEGPAKIQAYTNRVLNPIGGEHRYTIQHYTVDIPINVTGVHIADVAEISVAVIDPDLTGRLFQITGLSNKSLSTTRRLNVEEVTG